MPMTQRIRNLIVAFETERAEIDMLRSEAQHSLDTLPRRLEGSVEQKQDEDKVATFEAIHSHLNDIVFDLYHLIGEEPNGN